MQLNDVSSGNYPRIHVSNTYVHSNGNTIFRVTTLYSLMKWHYRNESTQIHRRCSTIWRPWHVQFARWVKQCTYIQRNFNLFKLMLNNNEQKINGFDVWKKSFAVGVKREIETTLHTYSRCVGVKQNKYTRRLLSNSRSLGAMKWNKVKYNKTNNSNVTILHCIIFVQHTRFTVHG